MNSIKLISICCFLINLNGFSQSMYSWFNGYEAGYHKACDCNKRIEKTNKLLYHTGTYSEGYDAGYTDGRIYLNSSNQNNSNRYDNQPIYKPDYDLLQQNLNQKQSTLSHRRQLVQNEYFAIQDIYIVIINRRGVKEATESEKEYFIKLKEITNKYGNYDLTNDATFNRVMNWLRAEKNKVSAW